MSRNKIIFVFNDLETRSRNGSPGQWLQSFTADLNLEIRKLEMDGTHTFIQNNNSNKCITILSKTVLVSYTLSKTPLGRKNTMSIAVGIQADKITEYSVAMFMKEPLLIN